MNFKIFSFVVCTLLISTTFQSSVFLKEGLLHLGDFVTHIDHGVGKFEGLHKIDIYSRHQEVIKLTYKDGDILYISIHSLHKIAMFSGKEGFHPKINQLGSPVWKKT